MTTIYHLEAHPAAGGLTRCCHKPPSAFPGHRNAGHAFTRDPALVTCTGEDRPARREPLPQPDPEPTPRRERILTCARCGNTFTTNRTGGVKYCGDDCREDVIREQKKARRQAGAA